MATGTDDTRDQPPLLVVKGDASAEERRWWEAADLDADLAEGRTGDTVVEPVGRPARTRHPAVTYTAFWVDAR